MYSTQKNITSLKPGLNPFGVCGKYMRYPKNPQRVGEGGLRIAEKYKSSNPEQPLVSVISVVLNMEKTIEKCIKSVLDQTYENIEYIVIDGVSEDNTFEIIRGYEDAIDYYISEPDSGIYNAMNKGLSLASGDYILILNGDDWYSKNAVKRLLEASLKYSADVTHSDAMSIGADNKYEPLKAWLHDGIYTRGNPVRHETMLVKKTVYNKYGNYDESYRILSDYIFIALLYSSGCSFHRIEEPVLYFRKTGFSYSAEHIKYEERYRFFKNYFPFLEDVDLAIFKQSGKLPVTTLLELIDKYKGKSELFVRSLAYNIADRIKEERFKTYTDKNKKKPTAPAEKTDSATEISHANKAGSGEKAPIVSVVVPVYNEELHLGKCLDTLINQTLKNIEIIIVNDNSTDNSSEIIQKYKNKDPRIRVIEHKENQGLGEARNSGVKASNGKYIYFLDSDDYLPTDSIETLQQIAEKYNNDIVIGNVRGPTASAFLFTEVRNVTLESYPALVYNHNAWNKLIRRDFFLKKELFFIPPRYAEDILFSITSNLYANSISLTTKITYYYRYGRQLNRATKQKVYDAFENNKKALAIIEQEGSEFLLHVMRAKIANNAFGRMIRASKVFNKVEMHKYLAEWRKVLLTMPNSVFEEIPETQAQFCRLIINSHFDKAIEYWKKSKKGRNRASNLTVNEAFDRLNNIYNSLPWRISAPFRSMYNKIFYG